MLYAKLFVAAGILLLAEGTPGPQFKHTRGFISPEEKPVDFKDMIIKKLLIRLNEALRNRGPPGHIPQPQHVHSLPQSQFQLSQAPQQIISHQHILPPQQHILQQHVSRKPIIQQQIGQRSPVQQLPPPPLLQQPQQGRPLLPPKGSPQFIHNCELQQQPFGNDVPGAFQYEYEEVPCPCCQCGGGSGAFEEIPCSFCQGLQYEEIPCSCCEQQQQIEECPFAQRPLPFNEIQPSSCNQNRPHFPQQIHANSVAPSGLSGANVIPGRPIFKETFGRLNLQYKASDDPMSVHRALQIIKPVPELTGLYRCTVSSYEGEATEAKKMVIYVPQSDIKFWHTVEADEKEDNSVEEDSPKEVGNIVNVTCAAEGVFPEPTIRIYSESKLVSDNSDVKTKLRNGLYDVSASVEIDDDDMNMQDHEFECELNIPEANYTVKRAIYVSLENNSGKTRILSIWLAFFMVTLSAIAPSLM